MNTLYTNEKNVQILIALMKQHHIKKIVISPGGTNPTFVGSVQQDSYFELYSSVDERSAAYMACGLAAESGEPVALSCTGATASRNYIPALTEAYYRKLPVLAITSSQYSGKVGHLVPQVTDRSNPLPDIVKDSILMPTIHCEDEEWTCVVGANKALLELHRRGGGPVHINLETVFSKDFSVHELPEVRVIKRICYEDEFPILNENRIAIFVGNHIAWSEKLIQAVDTFCEKYNAVVLCDQTSNYSGGYRVMPSLIAAQSRYDSPLLNIDLLIHIGEISGAYLKIFPAKVWRVNPDGEIRDTFKKLSYVFEMSETYFFDKYAGLKNDSSQNTYLGEWKYERERIINKLPQLPFSNIWLSQQLVVHIPHGAAYHMGILNSLRSANLFELPKGVSGYSNTGGFGIDGPISTVLGASLANSQKLFFCVLGDLAFFYDLNSLGNRHIKNNLRILLVNNGGGAEFSLHKSHDYNVSLFTAASGHFGNKSQSLVRHYATDLGFEYMSASTKDEFLNQLPRFTTQELTESSMLFEVFVNNDDESVALNLVENIETTVGGTAKQVAKQVLGKKGAETVKKILSRR